MEQLASKSIKEVLSEPEGQRLAQVMFSSLFCLPSLCTNKSREVACLRTPAERS